MRLTLVVAVACALAGCRTRPLDHPAVDPSAAVDMAGPTSNPDLAQSPPDLSVGPDLAKLGCAGLVQCIAGCGMDPNCPMGCYAMASPPSQQRFQSAYQCGNNYCLGVNGVGPMRCVTDPASSMFVDGPGVPPGDCNRCLTDVFGALFGYSCDSTDPACDNAFCKTPYEVCLNQ